MTLLGIETSCDETSAGVIKTKNNKLEILSNIISSSAGLHAKTGGIIPEVAAREQISAIIPVIKEALEQAGLDFYNPKIDAIALTVGPGLIGSLLVGIETAKALSLVWNKPIIPVNHLIGHIYANFIQSPTNQNKDIEFPALALIVSGGHTDLVLIRKHGDIKWLGGSRDDAAGEAFDKIGRMLDLPYPAGPVIEKLAEEGSAQNFSFPKPMMYSSDFDFSFSGLKASVFREISKTALDEQKIKDICAAVQESIVSVLSYKTIKAAKKYNVASILLGGGVAANQALTEKIKDEISKNNLIANLFVPPKSLCTDNGAMIAAAAFYNFKDKPFAKIDADPGLYF